MIAAETQCLLVGTDDPFVLAQTYNMAPATMKRVPAMKKGGRVSMANLIAR